MIDALIHSIGGYDSLAFALMALGCLFIGYGATIFFGYIFIPVVALGVLLFNSFLTNLMASSNADKTVSTLIPIMMIAAFGLTVYVGREKYKELKQKKVVKQ